MRWEGNRESSNVEDRRGSGGGMGGFGGFGGRSIGIGTIVLALVGGAIFGINPLTLLGIERLAGAFDAGAGGELMADYSGVTLAEADHTARFVAGCYAAFPQFHDFVAYSMCYFAAASHSEMLRRLGRQPPGFLRAGDREFATAVERWPRDGVPPNPGAWITTTANRKAIDRLRREARRASKQQEALMLHDDSPPEPVGAVEDDRLRLLFTCCHPALSMEARVALTLRMIGGLTVAEIAHAFLVQEGTMGRRISRAVAPGPRRAAGPGPRGRRSRAARRGSGSGASTSRRRQRHP